MLRVGILGGTFDPVHLGHIVPAQYALHHLRLDRVILVPSASPVHRPRHAPAAGEHRLAMCRLACASIPRLEASDVEIRRAEPSYTVLTLRYFTRRVPASTKLILLVGEDNLPQLHTWRDLPGILSLAEVAVLPRPCEGPPDLTALEAAIGPAAVREILARRVLGPLVPISATDIRRRVRDGLPIAGLVPAGVAAYIARHGLYL
ncbi:MAG: nicotinate (nicotinamide) nucleotide adenylyltransferase [Planctomycetes bacterium]|nr:nicotinate (nicotinamide) nucleotide adenylyltransferase [Planctomycetota bacterium]